MVEQLQVSRRQVAEFCRRHHIRRLALFGSVLTPDFNADSDVDVWVEFECGHTPGLAFFSMEAELSEILGRRVDLNTPAWLGPQLGNHLVNQLEVLYDTAESQGQRAPSAPRPNGGPGVDTPATAPAASSA